MIEYLYSRHSCGPIGANPVIEFSAQIENMRVVKRGTQGWIFRREFQCFRLGHECDWCCMSPGPFAGNRQQLPTWARLLQTSLSHLSVQSNLLDLAHGTWQINLNSFVRSLGTALSTATVRPRSLSDSVLVSWVSKLWYITSDISVPKSRRTTSLPFITLSTLSAPTAAAKYSPMLIPLFWTRYRQVCVVFLRQAFGASRNWHGLQPELASIMDINWLGSSLTRSPPVHTVHRQTWPLLHPTDFTKWIHSHAQGAINP